MRKHLGQISNYSTSLSGIPEGEKCGATQTQLHPPLSVSVNRNITSRPAVANLRIQTIARMALTFSTDCLEKKEGSLGINGKIPTTKMVCYFSEKC